MVGSAIRRSTKVAANNFDEFLKENPTLTSSNLALEYYSEKLLFSSEAKLKWESPDLESEVVWDMSRCQF